MTPPHKDIAANDDRIVWQLHHLLLCASHVMVLIFLLINQLGTPRS